MKNLSHPNVIHMFGSFIDGDFGQTPPSHQSGVCDQPPVIKPENIEFID